MDWSATINWHDGFSDGKFFWIEWHFWKVIGWTGNVVFFSRFIVQWLPRRNISAGSPSAFWWLSLVGTLLLLGYALFDRRDSVFIFAYAFSWIPYVRNLVIHRRHKKAHMQCPSVKSAVRRNPTIASRAAQSCRGASQPAEHYFFGTAGAGRQGRLTWERAWNSPGRHICSRWRRNPRASCQTQSTARRTCSRRVLNFAGLDDLSSLRAHGSQCLPIATTFQPEESADCGGDTNSAIRRV